MKFTAEDFNGKDVRLSIEAETEAELYQLKALRNKLFDNGAHCLDWNDMEDGRGICVVVEKMPNALVLLWRRRGDGLPLGGDGSGGSGY